jgi:hypothetical protein
MTITQLKSGNQNITDVYDIANNTELTSTLTCVSKVPPAKKRELQEQSR